MFGRNLRYLRCGGSGGFQTHHPTHQHPAQQSFQLKSFLFPFLFFSYFLSVLVFGHISVFPKVFCQRIPTLIASAGRLRSVLCYLSYPDRQRHQSFKRKSCPFSEHSHRCLSLQPSIMPVPSYGAMPLSKTFLLVRIMQVLAMIIIIGITSNFVSLIVSTGVEPPKEFVGTLSVVSISSSHGPHFVTDFS